MMSKIAFTWAVGGLLESGTCFVKAACKSSETWAVLSLGLGEGLGSYHASCWAFTSGTDGASDHKEGGAKAVVAGRKLRICWEGTGAKVPMWSPTLHVTSRGGGSDASVPQPPESMFPSIFLRLSNSIPAYSGDAGRATSACGRHGVASLAEHHWGNARVAGVPPKGDTVAGGGVLRTWGLLSPTSASPDPSLGDDTVDGAGDAVDRCPRSSDKCPRSSDPSRGTARAPCAPEKGSMST